MLPVQWCFLEHLKAQSHNIIQLKLHFDVFPKPKIIYRDLNNSIQV